MKLVNTIDEIGILKTNLCLAEYKNDVEIMNEAAKHIPIHNHMGNIDIIDQALFEILLLKKENIFLLSNELAILERIEHYKLNFENIIVGLSRNLSKEQINNIKNNIPGRLQVSYVDELDYPMIVKPSNSVILVTGYLSGKNFLIPKNTYRMLQTYKSFMGKIIFINCARKNINIRPVGWIIINDNNIFSRII